MYQLWIRKSETSWMLITTFDNANSIDYMLDQAREAGAQEAIILTSDGPTGIARAVAYQEFRRKTR